MRAEEAKELAKRFLINHVLERIKLSAQLGGYKASIEVTKSQIRHYHVSEVIEYFNNLGYSIELKTDLYYWIHVSWE